MSNPEGIGGPKEGEVRNPEGNNGHLQGWQRYGTRLQNFLGKTAEEFEAELGDAAKVKKRPLIDVVCAQHIRDMTDDKLTPEVRGKAREAALDRMEGKVAQPVRHGGDPDNNTPVNMDGTFTLTFGTEDNDGSDPAKTSDPSKT